MPLLNVTIGAGPTQISTKAIYCSQIIFQVNGSNPVYVGDDSTVSSTTGIVMTAGTPGGATNISAMGLLSAWYVAGTANDVVRIQYSPAIR
jgi:hypothetical protein